MWFAHMRPTRKVYRDALLNNGAVIFVAHNHPSGDPEPSRDDVTPFAARGSGTFVP